MGGLDSLGSFGIAPVVAVSPQKMPPGELTNFPRNFITTDITRMGTWGQTPYSLVLGLGNSAVLKNIGVSSTYAGVFTRSPHKISKPHVILIIDENLVPVCTGITHA